MSKGRRLRERGQALAMFAIMATALIGAVALVVDVGQLYMNGRRLQNVADMSALAGAQNRLPGFTCDLDAGPAVQDARRYAIKNGIATDSGANEGVWNPTSGNGVLVNFPPDAGNHVDDHGYIEVRVAKEVPALFAGVIGGGKVRLEGRAVAHGCGGYGEAAIVALDEEPDAIKSGGNADTDVTGNIYSRGGITANSAAGTMEVSGYAYARWSVIGDGLDAAAGEVTGTSNVPDIPDPKWPTPPPYSTGPNTVWNSTFATADAYGWKFLPAGTYQEITIANGDHVMFEQGVYRITGGIASKNFTILGVACGQGNPATTSLTNPDPGLPVSFVLDDGVTFEITATGVAHFRSAATIPEGCTGSPPGCTQVGNLIIRSFEDRNSVKIVGQGNVNLYGTVYTPAGDTALAGSTGGTVNGQVVTGSIELLGGTGPAVVYDPARVPSTRRATLVE